MSELDVSVVIPTRRRETRLAFALEALAGQTLDPSRFEVIVVRSDDVAAEPTTPAPPGLVVRDLASPRAGTATQRNVGWRAARAPLVAFTDDDCRADPGWLEALLADIDDGVIVQGRTEPDPDERHLLHGLARTITNVHESGWYETCNILYARSLLARLGGFDESIDFLGEDADLGLRAHREGARLRFADGALVWHAVHWRSLGDALRDARKRGTWPALVARYPEQRERLWLGVFTERDHSRLLLALGGLFLVRRAPLLTALAMLPFARHHFDRSRISAWGLARYPGNVAAKALVGTAELAALAASSARHRALVL